MAAMETEESPVAPMASVRMVPLHDSETENYHEHYHGIHDNGDNDDDDDDEIVEGLAYRQFSDDPCGGTAACTDAAKASCGRFAVFQERFLGPLSPERAPGSWMVINVFCLSWSFSLGVYLTLLYVEYGNETAASKANTTDYLVWSLLTTLVWVVEIVLRALFPPLGTVLVVSTPTPSDDEHSDEEEEVRDSNDNSNNNNNNNNNGIQTIHQHQFSRTFTMEESVVTLETVVQQRSTKHRAVIGTELLLAIFFGVETVLDCWNHWDHRHGPQAIEETDKTADLYDDYYGYDDTDDGDAYSMLQQQSDIWISVLAYAYMTYETYHQYHRAKINRRDIHRSLSTTLLAQQFQHQQDHNPRSYFHTARSADAETTADPSETLRMTTTRTAMGASPAIVSTNEPATEGSPTASSVVPTLPSTASSASNHGTPTTHATLLAPEQNEAKAAIPTSTNPPPRSQPQQPQIQIPNQPQKEKEEPLQW